MAIMSRFSSIILSAYAVFGWGWHQEPEQIHLSWGEEDDSMYVTWALQAPTWLDSYVYYTLADNSTSSPFQFSKAIERSFYNDQGNQTSRELFVYVAKMTGLEAGALYKYQVGSAAGYSNWHVFEAKRNFTNSESRFLVFGDFGTGIEIDTTMLRLIKEIQGYHYDAVFHIGDMAYDLNDDDGYNGDLFLNSIQPVAARMAYMTSQGNHEGPGHECTEHYQMRFQMPGDSTNFWYSFNTGVVHFISFSTEFVIYDQTELQQAQMEWLEKDLASVDRSKQPWVITLAHRPMYCSPDWYLQAKHGFEEVPWERHNKDCLQSGPSVQAAFEDLFYDYQVDLELYGHVHAYERLTPAYKNQSVPSDYETHNYYKGTHAPLHIITGIPGQQESYAPVSPTPLAFSVSQSDELGYGRLTIFNETTLLFEQISSVSGSVLDFVIIEK